MPKSYYDDRYGDVPRGYGRSASDVQPGISRSRHHAAYDRRYADDRGAGYRADGQRYGGESRGSDGRRPPDGRRRSPGGGRRPPSRGGRRGPERGISSFGFYAFIAVFAVVLIVIGLMILRPDGGDGVSANKNVTVPPSATAATPGGSPDQTEQADASATPGVSKYDAIASLLSDAGQIQGLAADQMVHVDGLSINENLSEDWMNVLLLGTDERTLTDSARTDAIIICSINIKTGEVKLTSILRDLAVAYDDIGEYNGTYRINAANYFGGPDLTMKTINELFELNIRYYVMVNFFGFAKVAQQLGGVEVDVDEQEMKLINERIVEQYKFAYKAGIMDFDTEQKLLEQYGEGIHLNGNQTLAYARIRKTDGGDYKRTTRQQIVLNKLLAKLKKLNAIQMAQLLYGNLDMVKTNLEPETILSIATKVVNSGLSEMKTFRLPQPNTYKEEVRNEQGMLYDCDFATNALKLYNFIYE